ncbi:ATP-binding protein [Streptomyces sp. NPDC058417]|uniref:ATP-binding protein n=1 Tax=unclassified Streptomyces TaxID=2593676 RepID=UPI00365148FD
MTRTVPATPDSRALENTAPSTLPAQAVFSKRKDAPARARAYVRDLLATEDTPLAEQRIDDVCLVVSELVTNAYLHGTTRGDSLRVVVVSAESFVRVEVHDPVRRRPRVLGPSAESEGGRGLRIVAGLAARWGVEERPFGKAVWAEVAR